MTFAPDVKPIVAADPSAALRELRESGLRISTARRLVVQALFEADGPVSAAHLIEKLSLDESSVYRNLEVLERHGLVRHLHLGHGPGLYALAASDEAEYLYCERCAKVGVIAPTELDDVRNQIKARFGYTPRFTHFAIVGICDDCAAAQAGEGAGGKPEALHSHGDFLHSHARSGAHTHPK